MIEPALCPLWPIADRRMIGSMLEQTLRQPSDPTPLRIDYLTFDRLEGRSELYMSDGAGAAWLAHRYAYVRQS